MARMRVGEVKVDPQFYPRNRLNLLHVVALRGALEAGATLPPIEVNPEGVLLDGAHRLEAYRNLYGDDHMIEVRVLPLTGLEALLYATRVNARHGLRLSPQDQARTAHMLLEAGASREDICEALSITRERLEGLIRRVVPLGASRDGGEGPVVLKRPLVRFYGEVPTERLVGVNRVVSGVLAQNLARQLLAHLEAGTYPETRSALEVLWRLYRVLEERFGPQATPSGASASVLAGAQGN